VASGKRKVKEFAAEAKIKQRNGDASMYAFGQGSTDSLYRFMLRDE